METWLPLPYFAYGKAYEISNLGRVRRPIIPCKRNGYSSHLYLKPNNNGSGYLTIELEGKRMYIHRLVAENFLPNPNNLPEVDHIDRDRENNSADNLRWVSRSNNQHNRTQLPSNVVFNKGWWIVRLTENRKSIQVARFKDEDEAREAGRYLHAERFREWSPYWEIYKEIL